MDGRVGGSHFTLRSSPSTSWRRSTSDKWLKRKIAGAKLRKKETFSIIVKIEKDASFFKLLLLRLSFITCSSWLHHAGWISFRTSGKWVLTYCLAYLWWANAFLSFINTFWGKWPKEHIALRVSTSLHAVPWWIVKSKRLKGFTVSHSSPDTITV